MVMSLLSVVLAVMVSIPTIVSRGIPHEAMLEALVPFLVPLEVTDHLLLLDEDLAVAFETVEVFSANGRRRCFLSEDIM